MVGFDAWRLRALPLPSAAALISVADVALAVIIGSATAAYSSAMHVRCLSYRPLQVIGMMCYSLYVWHVLLVGTGFRC
jgi:peptidoglycan/LPS O-acetylase OafA/YrhL